jgi:methylated-DNA-[protein]-cysteine S-methyltransferase
MNSGHYFTVDFEMGRIVVSTGPGREIRGVEFDLENRIPRRPSHSREARLFAAYFQGEMLPPDLQPDLSGESPFRKKVYRRVAGIPFGHTLTYGEVAENVGCAGGAQAVGQAMAANRFPLIIPCHRVVSAGGRIGGFSSGIGLKRYLLELEGVRF